MVIIRQKSYVDFKSTYFFKSEGFNVYCLVVSSIAWSFEFFTCGSILLSLRQDRMHGLVNCGSLLRQPSVLSTMEFHLNDKFLLYITMY